VGNRQRGGGGGGGSKEEEEEEEKEVYFGDGPSTGMCPPLNKDGRAIRVAPAQGAHTIMVGVPQVVVC